MRKLAIFLALIPPLVALYLLYTGSLSLFELALAIIVATVISYLFSSALISRPGRLYNPIRWAWALIFAILYLTVVEAKAHLSVLKLIFVPSRARPAIVRIPYSVESDYAITLIANSITNTPGTVVVDVDEERKYFYVHWIRATDLTEEGAKREVSELFERYARRIFE